jgi:hypothetical protein
MKHAYISNPTCLSCLSDGKAANKDEINIPVLDIQRKYVLL